MPDARLGVKTSVFSHSGSHDILAIFITTVCDVFRIDYAILWDFWGHNKDGSRHITSGRRIGYIMSVSDREKREQINSTRNNALCYAVLCSSQYDYTGLVQIAGHRPRALPCAPQRVLIA